MPTIIRAVRAADGRWGISIENPNAGAKVGRWGKAPNVPDLCYTCFGSGLVHFPAEGYRENTRGTRHGVCRKPGCRAAGDRSIGRLAWLKKGGG